MIRLGRSDELQRPIRQDDPGQLGIPTWSLVREAIAEGRTEDALRFLEYGCSEAKTMNDIMVSFLECLLSYIAGFDEEDIEKALRRRGTPKVAAWVSTTPGVVESLQRCAEFQRAHFGEITITEEPDKYMVRLDPCGSGGRLVMAREVGRTKKAYPWSWGRSGIPYYCVHCCLEWEIIPIEMRGYPIRVTLPGDKPGDPCIHFFYKKPELIPEEYFRRVGKNKTIV